MSEAHIVQSAIDLYTKQLKQNNELHRQRLEDSKTIAQLTRQLEAARSLTTTLEEEAHACPNTAHHRGWWESHEADL